MRLEKLEKYILPVGEIQVSFQGSMKNIKAVSLSGEKIPAFTEIKVSSVRDGILVVETL